MLRFYVEVARTAFRRQLIYRWANLAGLLTNAFFGSIFSYVIIALYHARPVVAGYNVNDTLRYIWLVQAMIMVVLPFGWTNRHRDRSFAPRAVSTRRPPAPSCPSSERSSSTFLVFVFLLGLLYRRPELRRI